MAEAQNQYGKYHLPEGLEKRPAVKAVSKGEVYEPETIAFMRGHCAKGDVIHAGTFFGDFIPGLSGGLWPGGQLWAFEPNPLNFAAAEKTVALNKLGNVNLTNAALSNTGGELLFRTRDKDGNALGGVSHLVDRKEPGVEAVKAVMLDYVVPLDRRVSIVQLDVEGHEGQALLGAYHIINRWKPILILEYFDKIGFLHRHLREVRYERVGKLHGNVVFAPEGHGLSL